MTTIGVTLQSIREAREAIRGLVRVTPLMPTETLSGLAGVETLLKCEQFQRTGSFKARGAANFVHLLSSERAPGGLVAASAGNHAQGIALAGARKGISVTVVMPVIAPLAKVNAARGYGATVVLAGLSLDEARKEAMAIAEREGRLYVPPFDDDAIIAGQGTVGLEILEQAPDVREVLVPAGGGGLLAGVALAIKESGADVRVVGVQSAVMDGIVQSLAAGRPTPVPPNRTIADGVAVAAPSQRTLDIISRYVDEVIAVPDEAIARAIVMLLERAKMTVEGAGALGVAALQSGAYRPKGKTVVVLSGGNIDINLLGSVVRKGLADAGRYQELSVEVADTPGELALVVSAISDAGANILEVDHDRESPHMPIGVVTVELLLEVNGPEHFDAVMLALRERGLRGEPGVGARLVTEAARRRHGRR